MAETLSESTNLIFVGRPIEYSVIESDNVSELVSAVSEAMDNYW